MKKYFILLIFTLLCCQQKEKTNDFAFKGYILSDRLDSLTFFYSPKEYGTSIHPGMKVFVAGSFNEWGAAKYQPYWLMKYDEPQKSFLLQVPVDSVLIPGASNYPEFKFVVFPSGWQDTKKIPEKYKKSGNLWIDINENGDRLPPMLTNARWLNDSVITLSFNEKIDGESLKSDCFQLTPSLSIRELFIDSSGMNVLLSTDKIHLKDYHYLSPFQLSMKNFKDIPGNMIQPVEKISVPFNRNMLKTFFSSLELVDYPLGFRKEKNKILFSIFAPRMNQVDLCLYENQNDSEPSLILPLSMINNALWETAVKWNDLDKYPYYQVRLNETELISDPYSKTNIYSSGKCFYVDDDYQWKDHDFVTPCQSQLVIYETHIINLTYKNPKVQKNLKGKFLSLTDTSLGSPLHHLKELGINTLEFYPSTEIANGDSPMIENNYDWGYMPALFFTPETDYISDISNGKHIEEFKKMVDALHQQGIAVILDVVYNHTSLMDCPLLVIDELYYYTGTNYSACGNDLDCKRPYVQKLLLDNMKYLTKELHLDGFRFDMAHLIEMPDLLSKERIEELNAVKPTKGNLILIGEHWGDEASRTAVAGRGIGQWNATFRERIKKFLVEEKGNEAVYKSFRHSFDKPWFGGPKEAVNYLESHDEETLVYYLEEHLEDTSLVMKKARLGAFILLFSAGPPMLLEGMEMGRSKSKQSQDLLSNQVHWDVSAESASLFQLYKQYIQLRKNLPVFRPESEYTEEELIFDDSFPEGVVGIYYKNGYGILINNTGKSETLTLKNDYYFIIANEKGTYEDSPLPMNQTDLIEMPPYSCRILKSE